MDFACSKAVQCEFYYINHVNSYQALVDPNSIEQESYFEESKELMDELNRACSILHQKVANKYIQLFDLTKAMEAWETVPVQLIKVAKSLTVFQSLDTSLQIGLLKANFQNAMSVNNLMLYDAQLNFLTNPYNNVSTIHVSKTE